MNKSDILGLILARGGSKGIPRKNLQPLGGRPLLAYTVEAALAAQTITRVIVSTDDAEIADTAKQCGAEVPFLRPSEYATDMASSISVVHHALGWLDQKEEYRPTGVVLLPPTCPFRTAEQIDGTVTLWQSSGLDSAMTIYLFERNPFAIFTRETDGRLTEVFETTYRPQRRQDLLRFFRHSQAVVISQTTYLESVNDSASVIHWDSVAGFEVDTISAFDIDTQTDLFIAEALVRWLRDRSKPETAMGSAL